MPPPQSPVAATGSLSLRIPLLDSMVSLLTKVQTSVAESSATLKKLSSDAAASVDLSQRVSALEKAVARQSSLLEDCINDTRASLSSLHTKLDEVLLSQQVAATVVVPPPPPPALVPSFTERDRGSLKLAVTLMITQGLSVTDLNQTLMRIVSRLSSLPAANQEGENVASRSAVVANPIIDDGVAFTTGSTQPFPNHIDLDAEYEEEEEAEAEEDSSCRSAAGGDEEDDDDDESSGTDVGVKHQSSALQALALSTATSQSEGEHQ